MDEKSICTFTRKTFALVPSLVWIRACPAARRPTMRSAAKRSAMRPV